MSPASANNSSFKEYKKLILAELKRHDAEMVERDRKHDAEMVELNRKLDAVRQEVCQKDLPAIRTEIAMLKLKAGLFGGLTSLAVVIGAILIRLLTAR